MSAFGKITVPISRPSKTAPEKEPEFLTSSTSSPLFLFHNISNHRKFADLRRQCRNLFTPNQFGNLCGVAPDLIRSHFDPSLQSKISKCIIIFRAVKFATAKPDNETLLLYRHTNHQVYRPASLKAYFYQHRRVHLWQ